MADDPRGDLAAKVDSGTPHAARIWYYWMGGMAARRRRGRADRRVRRGGMQALSS
ncbi:hypothetical protein ACIBQ1_20740 [Nonomuraea sp. NPDC050153]|uniref:hypothetical protein n=1 Tax=Nonomuraea sp. NPDC050153 TaxID=3364359 RepID=UPI0037A8D1CF